jgi:uncharacterized protein (DUF952 family)
MASLTTNKKPNSNDVGPSPLFHLVPRAVWESLQSNDIYYPATYEKDGFTHLTADPALLLEVANHFYTGIEGDFIVLELDTRTLNTGEVKYEPAAPVGDQETKEKYDGVKETEEPLFPHLYGGIPKTGKCLVGTPLPVARDSSTGQFLSISYPIAQITPDLYVASSAAVSSKSTMKDFSNCTIASLELKSNNDAERRPLSFEPSSSYVVDLSDDDTLSTEIPVLGCLTFIDDSIQQGHKVIVHSTHGASRAASVVIAHMMFVNGFSLQQSLEAVKQRWSRAEPRPNFLSQLSELDQGDGHDPTVAMRAVADILNGGNGATGGSGTGNDKAPATLADDEIENVIEFDDDDVAPEDSDNEEEQTEFQPITNDDDAMRMAAAAKNDEDEMEEGAATTGLDQLPEEKIEERAKTIFRGHTDAVCCIASSPTSTLMVSGGCDERACLWDAVTGETKHVLGETNIKETVAVCSFNFDGTLVATGALDGSVMIWNVDDGSLVHALEGPEEDINWISWHPKGNVILAGSSDMLIWMWMATTGDCMQVFSGHSAPVTCGKFAPNGKLIVTASADGTAKVWNPKNGKCRYSK